MKHSDVEELASKAAIGVCQALGWPEYAANQINRNSPLFAPIFAALVLEKAAEVCDAEANNWDDDKGLIVCAKAIRRMSAALQSGDRG